MRAQGGVDSNDRVNVRIHPIAKARMIAECERRSRQLGTRYTLNMLLNDFGWSFAPVAPGVELHLRVRGGLPMEDNGATTQTAGSRAAEPLGSPLKKPAARGFTAQNSA